MTDKHETGKSNHVEQFIGWAIFIIVLGGAYLVLKPFLSAVVLAAVLTFSLWPANRRIRQWLRGRRRLAALITTLLITVVLFVPFVFLGFNLAGDIQLVSSTVQRWGTAGAPQAPAWLVKIPLVGQPVRRYTQDIMNEAAKFAHQLNVANAAAQESSEQPQAAPDTSGLMETISRVFTEIRSILLDIVITVGQGMIQIIFSLLLTFFLLCDEALGERSNHAASRIAGKRGLHLLNVAGDTVRGVIYGIIGTAIVQGVLAAVGFAIAGVPGPVFLGLVTFFLSPLPVGPPLVWIPASLWLFAEGHTGWGIFMLAWGLLVVSTVDNVIKPWFISQGSRMPFILIFFGVIGGVLAFGFIGLFLGPSLLAITYSLVTEWLAERKIE